MPPTWMTHAWAHFGVREVDGPEINAAIADMYRDAGHPNVRDDAVPWCAAFVGACLERAGISSTRSLLARSYAEWGSVAEGEPYGAVAVFSRGTDPNAGHVGFIVGTADRDLFILGGNQANSVSVERYPRSRLLAIRMATRQPAEPSAFDVCLKHVLEMEGGFTDDPHDRGGPTNKGITLATLARHRGVSLEGRNRNRLIGELKAISKAEVREIYREWYWRPSRAPDMPPGIDLVHFDSSVNHGLRGGAELLQRAAGVTVDGEIGPITMAAVRSAEPAALIRRHAVYRERRYRGLPHFWRFGRGWLRRTVATRDAALSRERNGPPTPVAKPDDVLPTAKDAPMTETQSRRGDDLPTKPWTQSLTIWGTIITALSAVLPIVGPAFGLYLSAETVEAIGAHILEIVQAIGAISGILMTVGGRVRARTRLTHQRMEWPFKI